MGDTGSKVCMLTVITFNHFLKYTYYTKLRGIPKTGTSSLTNGHPKNPENLNLNLIMNNNIKKKI